MPTRIIISTLKLALAVFFVSMVAIATSSVRTYLYGRFPHAPRFIAHALGAWHDTSYLNCRECFLESYKKGVRYFEVDLALLNDQHVVAFHEGEVGKFGLPTHFSYTEFKQAAPEGVTLLDVDELAGLLADHSDTYLITDAKANVPEVIKGLCVALEKRQLDCGTRVLPQIYDTVELPDIKALGFNFKHIIFTLYRFGNRPDEVIAFASKNPEIAAITLPYEIFTEQYEQELHKLGVRLFVHTLNEKATVAEALGKKIDGVYTARVFNL